MAVRRRHVIIDFHTHVQPDTDVEGFIGAMDSVGIDIAVVHALAHDVADVEAVNRRVAQVCDEYPNRLIGFASLMPTLRRAAKDLEALVRQQGFRGLKLHPSFQHFAIEDPRLASVMDTCAELGVPVLFHTGGSFMREGLIRFSDSLQIDELAIRHPHTRIVMAHGNPFGNDPYIVGKHPNVYMDTSMRFSNLARLIPGIGPELLRWIRSDEKMIFGSDASPAKLWRFKHNLDPILAMDVPEHSRAKILGGTARTLLGLDS